MAKPEKNKAQAVLEMVLIFISLALLIIGGIKLFSRLNQHMLDRLDTYRRTRVRAVNSLFAGLGQGMDPQGYLEFGKVGNALDIDLPDIDFQGGWENDVRVLEAALMLRLADNIFNFVIPYQIEQLNEVRSNLTDQWREHENFWGIIFRKERWGGPQAYVDEIRALAQDTQHDGYVGYYIACEPTSGAGFKLQAAFNNPKPFGPYHLSPCSSDPSSCIDEHSGNWLDPRLPKHELAIDGPLPPNDAGAYSKYVTKYERAYAILTRKVERAREGLNRLITRLGVGNPWGGHDLPPPSPTGESTICDTLHNLYERIDILGEYQGEAYDWDNWTGLKDALSRVRDWIDNEDNWHWIWGWEDERYGKAKTAIDRIYEIYGSYPPQPDGSGFARLGAGCVMAGGFDADVRHYFTDRLSNGQRYLGNNIYNDMDCLNNNNCGDRFRNYNSYINWAINNADYSGLDRDTVENNILRRAESYRSEEQPFYETANIWQNIIESLQAALDIWDDPDLRGERDYHLRSAHIDMLSLARVAGINWRRYYP